jgi:flagellar assembly protein FliH
MSNQSTVHQPTTPANMRFRGCVITEHREPTPTESEQSRILKAAEKLAEEISARKVTALKKAESERWSAFEAAWEKTLRLLQADIQEQLIEMSMALAERILQSHLPNAEMLRRVIEETLAPISDLQGIRVRMSPADIDAARQGKIGMASSRYIEWVADPALSPGDVITESRNGIFDGRIKERLAVLTEALRDPARYAT